MLVVSRRPNDAILFPNLGITVRVLRLNHRVARLGIEAPPDIRVIREELNEGGAQFVFDANSIGSRFGKSAEEIHAIRNQLNTLNLGLCLYRGQMEAGLTDEANITFLRILDELERIDQRVGADESTTEDDSADPEETSSSAIRLLIVEDDTNQRELLAGLLSIRGCDVATASDGQEALDYLLCNEWPDFLLLDMWMPRCDGATTVRQIRESNASPNLKILAISGTSPDEFGIKTGADGVNEWFPKPLNPDGLIQYMNRVGGVDKELPHRTGDIASSV